MGNCVSKRSAKREQLVLAEANYNAAATALASREEELANTRQDLGECKERADTRANQVRELETQLQEHVVERDKAQNKAWQLEEAIVELERDRDALANQLSAVKSNTAAQLHTARQTAEEELSAARARAAKELALAEATIASSAEEFTAARKLLECNIASRDDAIESLKSLNKTLDDLAHSTKQQLDSREEVISSLLTERRGLEKDLSDLRQKHDDLRSKYRLLEADSQQRYRDTSSRTGTDRSSVEDEFSRPVRFSRSGKDVRIEVTEWNCETRIDIREWYYGRRSQKGLSLPVKDAQALANILPGAVCEGNMKAR